MTKSRRHVWLVWFSPVDDPEVSGVHGVATSLGRACAIRRQLQQNGWGISDMPIRRMRVDVPL